MSDAPVKAVVGLRRYGKSSHVVRMTQEAPRVVYYDTLNDDYSEGVVFRDVGQFEQFWRRVYQGRFRISLKPPNPQAYFPRLCELVWNCERLVCVVDEVHLYGGNHAPEQFVKLITAGGHRDIELIGVTQEPKLLGKLYRSQATTWDVFKLLEEDDRDYMRRRLGGVSELQLATLAKYEYLHYEDGADCYWRCKDDDETGQVAAFRERIDYETQAPAAAGIADPGQHADAG